MSQSGKPAAKGADPIRIAMRPGLRALLFSAHWVRGAERFTTALRVHMIQVTDTTEHIDVLEWAVDPLVEIQYSKGGVSYDEHKKLRAWAQRLLRKLFRRSEEIGRLRKLIRAYAKCLHRNAEEIGRLSDQILVMQENQDLLSRMLEQATANGVVPLVVPTVCGRPCCRERGATRPASGPTPASRAAHSACKPTHCFITSDEPCPIREEAEG